MIDAVGNADEGCGNTRKDQELRSFNDATLRDGTDTTLLSKNADDGRGGADLGRCRKTGESCWRGISCLHWGGRFH